ncbi:MULTISPECIES: aminotransferase class III-fold pyridoxal phosphate-dependent enzyme [unclassified Micromonospora]|uniref:aminotransferase class III-fold pyridoxal phosphate-dependent enzyme n=1 Tax=unclassified Micromonospora TaxID=2617518 RepID=UPI001B35EE68|nr:MULTISPECIES: aminotransferase class III-fold pyridoxal phosphate-dependent enzyme [unclassified Micromonospora]MBQ1044361.1 aminotransferase class III-fold pyridoxal phosphate-dependent enzyme [Micromonospora sp. C72]MBQ1056865.1 aminotransferase class III-fold pyridoxal phosphate-dependent enzyme [Micromonospora sp. C32]
MTTLTEDFRLVEGRAWLARAEESVVGGVKKMNRLDDPAHFPIFFTRSAGPYTWDADGNRYLDLLAGKGAVLIGHAEPDVDGRVIAAIRSGSMPPLTPTEYPVTAERLLAATGQQGRVKFFRTGSDGVSAAVRIARAATGRRAILTCGYHGWHEWFDERGMEGREPDGPAPVIDFHYDLDDLRELLDRTRPAAVVVTPEPALFDDDFVPLAAEAAAAAGALFILDEVKTGFRAGVRGFQSVVGVQPDLTVFGKALGNGYPVAALVGRADVMSAEQQIHISGTFETEKIGLAAAAATLDWYSADPSTRQRYEAACAALANDVDEVFASRGVGARFCAGPGNGLMIFSDDAWAVAFYRACARRGLLLYCFDDVNLMYAQVDLVPTIVAVIDAAVEEVSAALGPCPPLTTESVARFLRYHLITGRNDHARGERVVRRVARHVGIAD